MMPAACATYNGYLVPCDTLLSINCIMRIQFVGKTPSLAGCAKCHLKFLTFQPLMKQPEAAAQYLREKFARHTCRWGFSRRHHRALCKRAGFGS
jgi:hypothetical protein